MIVLLYCFAFTNDIIWTYGVFCIFEVYIITKLEWEFMNNESLIIFIIFFLLFLEPAKQIIKTSKGWYTAVPDTVLFSLSIALICCADRGQKRWANSPGAVATWRNLHTQPANQADWTCVCPLRAAPLLHHSCALFSGQWIKRHEEVNCMRALLAGFVGHKVSFSFQWSGSLLRPHVRTLSRCFHPL